MRSQELKKRAQRLEEQSFYDLVAAVIENSKILKEISPVKRRPWIARVVEELYTKQGGACAICGQALEYGSHEVDHIIPHSHGGGNESTNLQLACRSCNRSKRNNVDPVALLDYLENRAMNL